MLLKQQLKRLGHNKVNLPRSINFKEFLETPSQKTFEEEFEFFNEMYDYFSSPAINLLQIDSIKLLHEALQNINEKSIEKFKEFLPISQHNGFFEMIYNIKNLQNGTPNLTMTKVVTKTKNGEISLHEDENYSLEQLLKKTSTAQGQLLFYCISLLENVNEREITVDIEDYFKLRNIKKRDSNVKKLIEDFKVLERMYFTFSANVKGQVLPIETSKVLSVTDYDTQNNEIKFIFGNWVNTLSSKQYMLLNNHFFQYGTSSRKPYTFTLSVKLNEIVRNNLKHGKEVYSLNVGKLIDLLNFNESTIKAKGFVNACKDKIDNALDEIADSEGFKWHYRMNDHNTFKEYKKDYIEFSNPKLQKAYHKYKTKKK